MNLLGHQTYLKAKAGGDNSMSEKAEGGEAIKLPVRRAPDDKVKAELLEPKYPIRQMHRAGYGGYTSSSPLDRGSRVSVLETTLRGGRDESASSRVRTGHLNRPIVNYVRNTGSPTGREPYGDGAAVVVRGRESQPHGEGRQVNQMFRAGGA